MSRLIFGFHHDAWYSKFQFLRVSERMHSGPYSSHRVLSVSKPSFRLRTPANIIVAADPVSPVTAKSSLSARTFRIIRFLMLYPTTYSLKWGPTEPARASAVTTVVLSSRAVSIIRPAMARRPASIAADMGIFLVNADSMTTASALLILLTLFTAREPTSRGKPSNSVCWVVCSEAPLGTRQSSSG